ncbi:MAG: CRISPR-associated protein Csx19, partial [Cyanobacteria bacterium P01_G01_bin.4]
MWQGGETISLSEAIKKISGCDVFQDAIGLFYSSQACAVGRLSQDSSIQILSRSRNGWKQSLLEIETIFEARIFSEQAELRWLKNGGDSGDCLYISTIADSLPIEVATQTSFQKCLSQQYLIWGKADDVLTEALAEDWTVVSTSQIGTLAIPFPSPEAKQVIALES